MSMQPSSFLVNYSTFSPWFHGAAAIDSPVADDDDAAARDFHQHRLLVCSPCCSRAGGIRSVPFLVLLFLLRPLDVARCFCCLLVSCRRQYSCCCSCVLHLRQKYQIQL
eukprot:TRINITY_DN20493_c0_g1_i1.p1 TRINITY_DN20493_c0_g1~~TRINITY_DN20493_c0_g1_i1.p1  ORF type:complete len:109 (-),score=9.53 TRINITY_DN20493_c0_g1_i1:210-536(-)